MITDELCIVCGQPGPDSSILDSTSPQPEYRFDREKRREVVTNAADLWEHPVHRECRSPADHFVPERCSGCGHQSRRKTNYEYRRVIRDGQLRPPVDRAAGLPWYCSACRLLTAAIRREREAKEYRERARKIFAKRRSENLPDETLGKLEARAG